jgi:hypothetical protein
LAWSSRASALSRYACSRVSGVRQRNSRKASPENLASTMNAGSAAARSTASAAGENAASSAARLTSAISCWPIEKVLITIDSGRDDASRRARVSMS